MTTSTKPKPVSKFEVKIRYTFGNVSLLHTALTHRSLLNDSNIFTSNERLEFLGDAVLELITTEFLFKTYPDLDEGRLTSIRSALVRTEHLAEVAEKLSFGSFIKMSKGEEQTGGRTRPYILANTVESIIGAMYLDGGIAPCTEFVIKYICVDVTDIIAQNLDVDAKSRLQEITQEQVGITPHYIVASESGPDHDKTFEMGVFIDNFELAKGTGKSKQTAERDAAKNALEQWTRLKEEFTNRVV